jgi:transposase
MDISTVHQWVRKSRDSGGNVDMNDQPRSGRPVTATHYVNRQKVYECVQKNRRTTQTAIAEMLNIGLACVNDIIAGLAYKKVCSMGAASAYAQNEKSKTGSMSAISLVLQQHG